MAFVGAAALLLPIPIFAERRSFMIGILTGDAPFHRNGVQLFKARLAELGYVDTQNIIFHERFSNSPATLSADARDLVGSDIDVLVAFTTQPAIAARAATTRVPIVFAVVSDPVDAGLVATLHHPGGNATGLALMQPDLSAKQVQLLKELLPRLSRVAVLWNAGHSGKRLEFNEISAAARALDVGVVSIEVRRAEDFEAAFAALKASHADALMVLGEPLVSSRNDEVFEFAVKRQFPCIGDARETAEQGALISYSPKVDDQFRDAAVYVDRILRGAKPEELPVEQPTKFELVVNLKTAKALGLTIPPSLFARADEVIE
jgi:putative tryptophan/tyrosine transport system substrate-binding protein